MLSELEKKFDAREPILRDELLEIMNPSSINTFSQEISFLLKNGILRKFENGIYYIPEKDSRFTNLKPDIRAIIEKKYCSNYRGFRTGAYLLNLYGFTSQVSSVYEILSSNVSPNTRNKKVLHGQATVSAAKIDLNIDNYYYLVFVEIIRNIKYSDYSYKDNIRLLVEIYKKLNLVSGKVLDVADKYKSNRFDNIHKIVGDVLQNEVT